MSNSLEGSKKSIFQKPDVLFGAFVGLCGLGWIGLKLLPILTAIIWNTVNFGIALVVGGLLLYILTNKKTWMILHYLHEMTLKKMFGLIMELDPFIIAEDYIKDMEKERERFEAKSVELAATKESTEIKIKEKEAERANLVKRAQAAQKAGEAMEVNACAEEIQFIEDFITQVNPMKENLTKLGLFFEQVTENSAYTIRSAKSMLNIKKQAYEMVKKADSTLNSAKKLLTGNPDKKYLMEQSMEVLKNDIGFKLANMKNSLKISAKIMTSVDLDRASDVESGMALLEKYNPENLKLTSIQEKVPEELLEPGKIKKVAYKNLLD
jgi:hypothetical protein